MLMNRKPFNWRCYHDFDNIQRQMTSSVTHDILLGLFQTLTIYLFVQEWPILQPRFFPRGWYFCIFVFLYFCIFAFLYYPSDWSAYGGLAASVQCLPSGCPEYISDMSDTMLYKSLISLTYILYIMFETSHLQAYTIYIILEVYIHIL